MTDTRTGAITVAALQYAFSEDREENVAKVEAGIREAAAQGANVILPPELFEGPYFPTVEREEAFALAHPVEDHPTLARIAGLARELHVAVPVSFFERAGPAYYNSLAMIGVDGAVQGVYRKSHIPDGPGYEEKYYFRPGDTGFRVWPSPWGTLGIGICWDQWFPEAARAMVLQGADVLFYPTAIGTEPEEPDLDTKDPWQRAMIGHAVANVVPVVAANRVGTESRQTFYGHSFIADPLGEKVAEIPAAETGVILATFDLEAVRRKRAAFGFFRDRRPELYGVLTTADGRERG
jgi:N-carbamoylputrescine amidase